MTGRNPLLEDSKERQNSEYRDALHPLENSSRVASRVTTAKRCQLPPATVAAVGVDFRYSDVNEQYPCGWPDFSGAASCCRAASRIFHRLQALSKVFCR